MTDNTRPPITDPEHQPPGERAPGDNIQTGNISNSSVAIGRGARATLSQGATYNLSGDFRGAILNIESTLKDTRQRVDNLPGDDAATRGELGRLVAELSRALAETPPPLLGRAQEMAEATQALIDAAAAERPNRTAIRVLGEAVRDAAAGAGQGVPQATALAEQILAAVAKLAG